jgi:hypothetical protein
MKFNFMKFNLYNMKISSKSPCYIKINTEKIISDSLIDINDNYTYSRKESHLKLKRPMQHSLNHYVLNSF